MAKQIYRSSTDKKIAGVCGGIAEYFGFNVTFVRIVFIVLLLPGGLPGFIPYLLLWLAIPKRPGAGGKSVIDV